MIKVDLNNNGLFRKILGERHDTDRISKDLICNHKTYTDIQPVIQQFIPQAFTEYSVSGTFLGTGNIGLSK